MNPDDDDDNENGYGDEEEEDEAENDDDSTRSFSVFVQDSHQRPVSGIDVHCDYGLDGSDTQYTGESGHAYFEANWQVASNFRIFVRGVDMGDGDYYEVEYDGETFTVEYD